MKFKYITLPGRIKDTKRPLIPVKFKYKERETLPFFALVDSGADYSYCTKDIGDYLGIDWDRIEAEKSFGIEGSEFVAYPKKIWIEIGGHKLKIVVHFTNSMNKAFPCVLGQEGIFDQNRIIFERYKWSFQVVPK